MQQIDIIMFKYAVSNAVFTFIEVSIIKAFFDGRLMDCLGFTHCQCVSQTVQLLSW